MKRRRAVGVYLIGLSDSLSQSRRENALRKPDGQNAVENLAMPQTHFL
jgi:hypothetical protein